MKVQDFRKKVIEIFGGNDFFQQENYAFTESENQKPGRKCGAPKMAGRLKI